jgi:TPR repeat protein
MRHLTPTRSDNLGVCYENGDGVNKDSAEAVKWYRLAAEQENSNAQCSLGACYSKGNGIPKDYVMGYMWCHLSAASGHEIAAKNRDLLRKAMTPEQIAEAQKMSREWVEKHKKE